MELVVEIAPRRKAIEFAKKVASYVDGFDIPESPMGIPSPNAIVLGVMLKNLFSDKAVYPHIRLADLNYVSLASLVMAAELGGLDALLMTVGDRPRFGEPTNQLTTERALEFLRNEMRIGMKLGAILSLRYPLEMIKQRIEKPFDIYAVLRTSRDNIDKLAKVCELARALGKKVYTYIIVTTEKNRSFVTEVLDQPSIPISEVEDFVYELRDIVDGVIVSCPLDSEGQIEALRKLSKKL